VSCKAEKLFVKTEHQPVLYSMLVRASALIQTVDLWFEVERGQYQGQNWEQTQ
jgi:Tfp pilus assembly protein PilP